MSHRFARPERGHRHDHVLLHQAHAEQREYTSIIRNSGEALLSIVDDVLDYTKSRPQEGAGRAPFPLRTLLEEIVELLRVRAHDKGIEIASLIDARVPDRVSATAAAAPGVTNLLGTRCASPARHVAVRMTVVGTTGTAFSASTSAKRMGIPREQQKNLSEFGRRTRHRARAGD